MKAINVVVLGASGAVGSAAIETLSNLEGVQKITALVRRPLEQPVSPKLNVQIVNVTEPQSYVPYLRGHDAAICIFGAGQPSKVSHEEFKAIDYDAVLAFAKACHTAGVQHFELLGSIMADPAARSFYLKSKGRLREAIAGLNFERFSCFQPSMILTPTNRYGPSQAALLAVWPVISALLVGPASLYRGIRVQELGAAMANNLFAEGRGVEVLHWRDFKSLLHQH